jgi:hypothetical protein
VLFKENRIILFLDVHTFVIICLTVLHHYHRFVADTAGGETLFCVSGRVSFSATGKTMSPRDVPGQGNTKKGSTEELWDDLA